MSDRDPVRVGERIASWCVGALACAVCLSLAIELLQTIWPWLVGAVFLLAGGAFYHWRQRRW